MRLASQGPAVPTAELSASPPTGRPMAAVLAVLTALAGGLALAAAFPPAGIWPLAAIGPALLIIALWRQRARTALAAGAVFGLAFFFPLLSWLVNVAWYVWAALAIAETVIFAVLTVGQWLLLRLRAWPLAVAGWWVVAEAVRDRWPWQGFPWGRLVMSQATAPTVHWVAFGGPPFLTFLIALTAACLARLLLGPAHVPAAARRSSRAVMRGRGWPGVAVLVMAGLCLSGAFLPVGGGTVGGGAVGGGAAGGLRPAGRPATGPLSWPRSRATCPMPATCRTCCGPPP